MSVMTATRSAGIPQGRPFTVDDLEAMPDDGNRYELIDGMLVVSPAPGTRHQKILFQLAVALNAVCPNGLHVFPAPFAVRMTSTTELQPDVLVAREEDLTEKLLSAAPVLAVEVLLPSSVINDLNNKKAAYERMGVPSYWVVDPQAPSIVVFELVDGRYEQAAEVKDSDVLSVERPFPVRIVPRELLGTLAS
ncbi:Uma2 family endonuclease [Actinophytocola glycyrrhizae]|uniref:Uma2 family endonuclease n=1 Tax=Actinophytocola glycyrrhizae TaxID=2044873 RepID=A0ABV9SBI3_9PSEU